MPTAQTCRLQQVPEEKIIGVPSTSTKPVDSAQARMVKTHGDLTPFMAAMAGSTADPLQLLVGAVEAAANGILITDRSGTILWTNPAFTKMTGYSKEESVGRNPRFLNSGRQSADFYHQLWETITSGNVWHGSVCNRRKDGSEYTEEMTISPIRNVLGQIGNFIAIKHDISEKIRSAEQQARLVFILEATTDFVGMADSIGRCLFINGPGRKLIGIGEQEKISENRLSVYHPQWANKLLMEEAIPTAITTGTWTGETALLTREGQEIPVSQVIVAKKNSNGEVEFLATIMRDLTMQKTLEEQFHQAQKMEAVGQLAGGVAHDFNNLLTVISGYSALLVTRLPANDPTRGFIEEILKAGERAAHLTRQLLTFSRKAVAERRVLDLNALVTDTEKMLRRLIGEDISMATTLAPALGQVKADAGQIEQVIMNMAVNARDAMPQGGKLAIETANAQLGADYAMLHPEVKPGRYVMMAVSDSGSGMSQETKAHIFEPFFTTKSMGKGTGLGLATVYGIVKQSGGHIEVHTALGQGTTFKIYLPLVEDKASSGMSLHSSKIAPHGTETILLVEDEDAVRAITKLALQSLDYTILEAKNGEEAVRISERHTEPIHLLITDVVMPVMGGRQVAERMAACKQGIKVLYLSGYTDDAVLRHGILQADVAFLQKPFTPMSLANKVRAVLDK
jgi:two-component system cell cycle sensor histidine kinase/response regulator CckA